MVDRPPGPGAQPARPVVDDDRVARPTVDGPIASASRAVSRSRWNTDRAVHNYPAHVRSLVRPSVDLYDAWLAAHHEWGPGLHEDGFGIGEDDDVDSRDGFEVWVGKLRQGDGDLWWIVEDGTVLGGIAMRAANDPRAAEHGHIGYGVRPSARGRGVASWALQQVVALARDAGRESVALVCLSKNMPSIKTIERCGGVFEGLIADGRAQRFVIELG